MSDRRAGRPRSIGAAPSSWRSAILAVTMDRRADRTCCSVATRVSDQLFLPRRRRRSGSRGRCRTCSDDGSELKRHGAGIGVVERAAGRAPATAAAARNSGGGRSSSCRRSRAAAPSIARCRTGPPTAPAGRRLVSVQRPLEAAADVQEAPAVAARHVLHLHAAEGRQVGDHAVQVHQRPRRTARGPCRRRKSWWSWLRIRQVSIDSRSRTTRGNAAQLVQRRAAARRGGFCLEDE